MFVIPLKIKLWKFIQAKEQGTKKIKIWKLMGVISKHRFRACTVFELVAPKGSTQETTETERKARGQNGKRSTKAVETEVEEAGRQERLLDGVLHLFSKRTRKFPRSGRFGSSHLSQRGAQARRSTEDQRDPTFKTGLNSLPCYTNCIACGCHRGTSISFLCLSSIPAALSIPRDIVISLQNLASKIRLLSRENYRANEK